MYTQARLQRVASEPPANWPKVKPDPECVTTAQRILDLVLKGEIAATLAARTWSPSWNPVKFSTPRQLWMHRPIRVDWDLPAVVLSDGLTATCTRTMERFRMAAALRLMPTGMPYNSLISASANFAYLPKEKLAVISMMLDGCIVAYLIKWRFRGSRRQERSIMSSLEGRAVFKSGPRHR